MGNPRGQQPNNHQLIHPAPNARKCQRDNEWLLSPNEGWESILFKMTAFLYARPVMHRHELRPRRSGVGKTWHTMMNVKYRRWQEEIGRNGHNQFSWQGRGALEERDKLKTFTGCRTLWWFFTSYRSSYCVPQFIHKEAINASLSVATNKELQLLHNSTMKFKRCKYRYEVIFV